MSKIQGKPFVELVIDTLGDKKKDLLELVNGSDQTPAFRSLMNASHLITGADKNKVQFVVLETWNKTYTGYLVYNNSYCVLFAFHNNTQDMEIVSIDLSKQSYKLIKQPLSIVEFRMYLMEADDHIEPGEIDSGEAAANALLVADGEGGTDFVSPEEGSAQYLLGLDSEGNIVKDELPEGIVVDQTIVEDSENAVAGGAVYDALAEIGDDITDINNELENKANVDGNYPTMTVGAADNLTPYDEDSGVDQEQPFLLQGTGCGNGEQQVDTGALGLLKEKRGNSVVVNQKLQDFAVNSNSQYIAAVGANIDFVSGHKYIFIPSPILTGNLTYYINTPYRELSLTQPTLITGVSSSQGIYIYNPDEETVDVTLKNKLIDLTQWFNGDIPQDLLDNPSNFFRYYQGSLAYNEGTLVNANGRYIKCIGMNQWDEEWELGSYSTSGGNKDNWQASGGSIRSKNKVKVIPNTTYYCKVAASTGNYILFYDIDNNYLGYVFIHLTGETFTTPANACYIAYRKDGVSTYGNDTSINLYYEDEPRCLTYEPYQVLTNNDTGNEVLRSAGSVKDSKAPDGTITRRIGVVDLGTLTWTLDASGVFICYAIEDMKQNAYTSNNIVCPIYSVAGVSIANMPNMSMRYTGYSKAIMIKNTQYDNAQAFMSAMNGIYLFYELAEPTTEQGTPYSENLVIDDFGSMDFGSDVPQGALIFYPVDYKAFVDTLYKYTDSTPSNIALKSDVSSEQSARESVDTQLNNALCGTLRQLLANAKSIDFLNTDVIDLGTLTYYYDNSNQWFFVQPMATIKAPSSSDDKANILSTGYKTVTRNNVANSLEIAMNTQGNIILKNTSYTDTTTFKNAMKGVLLAYEKAEE